MEKWLYVMIIKKGKSYNRVTKAVITEHAENLKKLDDDGKLELCGLSGAIPVLPAWSYLKRTATRKPTPCASRNLWSPGDMRHTRSRPCRWLTGKITTYCDIIRRPETGFHRGHP